MHESHAQYDLNALDMIASADYDAKHHHYLEAERCQRNSTDAPLF
jgi:hypothetical protein